MRLVWILLLGGAAAAFAAQARQNAPAAAAPQLQKTAEAVAGYIRADPAGVTSLFAPEFLAQIPSARLEAIFKQIYVQLGSITGVKLQTPRGANSGVFTFTSAKHFTLPVTLTINAQPDHNITGLLFGPPTAVNDSLAAVTAEMRALPGQVSFLARSLAPAGAGQSLAEVNPEQALAIGSAFKLYVLGALTQQIADGRRRWDQVVPLETHSLPSGQLQTWPLGSPLTLDSIASLMISISDNTAADQLLHTVGREHVEAILGPMGNGHPARNQPFLTTLEMFQLKYGSAARRQQYAAADAAGRRALVAKLPAAAPPDLLAGASAQTGPIAIDQLEWFASAADLCHALSWLQGPG
ncbi:MAG: serine hydrolase, partial [Terriglobales bacterium]